MNISRQPAAQSDDRDRLVRYAGGDTGHGADRLRISGQQRSGKRINRGVLPEVDRGDRLTEVLGQFTGQDDGIT